MRFIRFQRYLRGHVQFFARSGSFERLINLCAHHRVPLWDCRREEAGYSGRTTVDGYRRMRPLARKAGAVTRVKERHGLPFLLRRYRRRIGVAAGAALFIAFFAVTQQFVWVVEVQGNERVDSQVLLQALEELGVRRGVLKAGSTRGRSARGPAQGGRLSWAALNIRGTTAALLVRNAPCRPEDRHQSARQRRGGAGQQIVSMAVTDDQAAIRGTPSGRRSS
ncbi:MAG: sporulation protein YqfD [Anaerotruncus massiliensis (ex Togo et al. 2019)]